MFSRLTIIDSSHIMFIMLISLTWFNRFTIFVFFIQTWKSIHRRFFKSVWRTIILFRIILIQIWRSLTCRSMTRWSWSMRILQLQKKKSIINAKIITKSRDCLDSNSSLKFNDTIIERQENDIYFRQISQSDHFQLIQNVDIAITSSKNKIKFALISNSLAVDLSFGQKFKPDPRVDVRPGWTDQSSQLDSKVDVRRVLPSLFNISYI